MAGGNNYNVSAGSRSSLRDGLPSSLRDKVSCGTTLVCLKFGRGWVEFRLVCNWFGFDLHLICIWFEFGLHDCHQIRVRAKIEL